MSPCRSLQNSPGPHPIQNLDRRLAGRGPPDDRLADGARPWVARGIFRRLDPRIPLEELVAAAAEGARAGDGRVVVVLATAGEPADRGAGAGIEPWSHATPLV